MTLNLSNKKIIDADNIFSKLPNPEMYTSIDLSNNLLTNLPKNLSFFSSLNTLKLTNNKFFNYNSIAKSLSTLPELQELTIDLSNQENVIIILSSLPNLLKLNGQSTLENQTLQESFLSQSNEEYKKNELISLNEETNDFEFIYKQINNEEFNKKFQKKLRDEIININNNLDIPNALYNAIIVKSKLEIYCFILEEVFNMILQKDNLLLKNYDSINNIINIIKYKLKYNQNILFDLVMNNDNDNIININSIRKEDNNNIKINFNKIDINETKYNKNYEITRIKEISILDSLNAFNINNNIHNKIKIIYSDDLILLLEEIYEYHINQKSKDKNNFIDSLNIFLNKKYGLKSIASFWYDKIMESINFYEKDDKIIFLFKKILEKKIDEYYYNDIKIIQKKFESILSNKNNDLIRYDEWIKLVENNISEFNSKEEYINKIIEYINNKNEANEIYKNINKDKNGNLTEKNILVKDFINIFLEIKIKIRENKYNIFLNNFKQCDKDNNGLIDKDEFIELIYFYKNIDNINKQIINRINSELNKLPENYISINDCLELLSKAYIDNKNILNLLLPT